MTGRPIAMYVAYNVFFPGAAGYRLEDFVAALYFGIKRGRIWIEGLND